MGKMNFGIPLLKPGKKLMKNVENGITDIFKHLPQASSVFMSQVNQNFHEHWNKLLDWLTFHMTPEAFIISTFVNNKYEYTSRI